MAEQDADSLFAAGDWVAAAEAYRLRTLENPEDAAAWFQLAVSERHAERYSTALDALNKAEELSYAPVRIRFERARLRVLADDAQGAVEELRALVSGGFAAVNFVTGDPLLASLDGYPGYDALIEEMSVQAFPCEHDALFSAFDFWVGAWDVHVADGGFAGSNEITRSERGCVLIENWQGAGGGTGTSINYPDKITGEWVQIWNAANGGQINIRGGMTDDGMLLAGTIHYVASGTTAAFRGLWTPLPDGRVRQFFEQSADDGKTWSPWFEGFYTRKPAE
ncbi:MAG: hypothetical protein KJP16_08200 [Gammaproteobacteria bacterium]|nr:hypothetical protein [Gammaproteobacteria bacterium]NNL50784.1 tetratricopeptide repeat protein [Woeseiaceae bacterium]